MNDKIDLDPVRESAPEMLAALLLALPIVKQACDRIPGAWSGDNEAGAVGAVPERVARRAIQSAIASASGKPWKKE